MSDALTTQYCDDHCCNTLCHLAMALDDCKCHRDDLNQTQPPRLDTDKDAQKQCCDDMHRAIRAAIDATLACYDECCKS